MIADLPVLYSFRRCPYAMRARLALRVSGIAVEHREVLLRDKPDAMLEVSPKGTVPVLVPASGGVVEESLDIMLWALRQNDPENWLEHEFDALALVKTCDTQFKPHLDRYKYANRYDGAVPHEHRAAASDFIMELDTRLQSEPQLMGPRAGLADFAIFPFVRQFANTDIDWFNAQAWSAVSVWLEYHVTSELFAQVMEKRPPWHPHAGTDAAD